MNKEMTNVLTLKEIAGLANFATVGILAMADSTGEDLQSLIVRFTALRKAVYVEQKRRSVVSMPITD